jgi:galactose-1-phosphate uridylyltransferase
MILDNPDIYLSDYEKFKEVYYYSCRTIVVTQEENDALSKLTVNDGNTYKVLVPTNLKYNHLGIKLYMRPDSTNKWKLAEEIETNILDVPQELLNYEKDFLV